MKTICVILLVAGVCSLASAQTSTTPCANGQPYVNGKCLKMPVCALRCIWNAGAPKYVRCFWGPPIPAVECPAGYQACGATTVNRWGLRLDNERMNGYRCAYTYKRWNGLQN